MALSPARRPAGAEGDAGRSRRLEQRVFRAAGRIRPTPRSASASAPAGIAARSLHGTFTEAHILAITQAICDYRQATASTGRCSWARTRTRCPAPAQRTALEVLAANGVDTVIQRDDGFTPTPVISHAILVYNRGRTEQLADGIVITPSHNPPEDGGFKYNPPNGGPADTDVTHWIEDRANELLRGGNAACGGWRSRSRSARRRRTRKIWCCPMSSDLRHVIDMDAIRAAGCQLGVDPLGGAALAYWEPINRVYGLNIDGRQPGDRSDVLVHDGRS